MLSERKIAVTPMGDMLRFAGTLELAGHDLSINQRRVIAMHRAVHDYLRGMDNLELVEIWRGLRPLIPDTLPIIGYGNAFENLIFAIGHGMLGISLELITGKLVSQLLTSGTTDIDVTSLSIDRFS